MSLASRSSDHGNDNDHGTSSCGSNCGCTGPTRTELETNALAKAYVHWRRVRAKVLARKGQFQEAVDLATGAADMVRPSDDLDKRGQALLDLAEVLRLASRMGEAATAARDALDLFERKGSLAKRRATEELLAALA
jgi:tetratricopeptide (TPR) repeat protein